MEKNIKQGKMAVSKFIVKTKLSNIKKEDDEFTYNEEIVSMKWDAKAQRDAVQSGKGPGEFGPDYSDRKKFHLDYHANWEHPTHDTMGRPLLKRTPYPVHVIEPFVSEEELTDLHIGSVMEKDEKKDE